MKVGAYIGLAWAIIGNLLLMLLDQQLRALPQIIEGIFFWTILGAILGGAISLLARTIDHLTHKK